MDGGEPHYSEIQNLMANPAATPLNANITASTLAVCRTCTMRYSVSIVAAAARRTRTR